MRPSFAAEQWDCVLMTIIKSTLEIPEPCHALNLCALDHAFDEDTP